jgi:hypothetical protein
VAARQNRRVLSGIITGALTLYALAGIVVPFFEWFIPLTGTFLEGVSFWLMPFVVAGMLLSVFLPLLGLLLVALTLHWYLCKLMNASIDY